MVGIKKTIHSSKEPARDEYENWEAGQFGVTKAGNEYHLKDQKNGDRKEDHQIAGFHRYNSRWQWVQTGRWAQTACCKDHSTSGGAGMFPTIGRST